MSVIEAQVSTSDHPEDEVSGWSWIRSRTNHMAHLLIAWLMMNWSAIFWGAIGIAIGRMRCWRGTGGFLFLSLCRGRA